MFKQQFSKSYKNYLPESKISIFFYICGKSHHMSPESSHTLTTTRTKITVILQNKVLIFRCYNIFMKVNVGAVFELFKTAVICICFVVKITTLMF